jgi:hypothetical protein
MTVQDRAIVATALDQLRRSQVAISRDEFVQSYLLNHEQVAEVLPAVVADAHNKLGQDAQLELLLDGSSGVGNEYLVLRVRLPHYEDETVAITRELTQQAWQRMQPLDSHFLVTTDFAFAS